MAMCVGDIFVGCLENH